MDENIYKMVVSYVLPEKILDWFDVTDIQKTGSDAETTLHIHLSENAIKPEYVGELSPNGFTREAVYEDFPIRGSKVLLHVKRRRWLNERDENVMTDYNLIQQGTRCSTEFAFFLKQAFG